MVSIKHKKNVTIPDDPAAASAGMVVSSDWNNTLDFKAEATAILLGRKTAGVGDIEELSASDARTLLGLVPGLGADNIVQLDGGGKLDTSVLPALAISETFVVANQTAMLALSAQMGDFAIRSDVNKTFVLSTNSPSTLADWKEILVPGAPVTSIDGQTGNPTIGGIAAAVSSKATPVDADKLPISDSAAGNATKHLTWANFKAAIKAYMDTLYQAVNTNLTTIAGLTPSTGNVLTWNGLAWTAAAPSSGAVPTFIARDEKTAGTTGGTSPGAAWQVRTINTVAFNDIVGASLSGNQITLPNGTYDIEASCPFSGGTYRNKTRLRNVTDGVTLIDGTSETAEDASPNTTSRSFIKGRFSIAGTRLIALEHWTSSTNGIGFGAASNAGVPEIYSMITIRKVG